MHHLRKTLPGRFSEPSTLAVKLIFHRYAPGQLSVISLSMLITETNIDDCITMLVLTFLNMTVKLKRGG